MPTVISAADFAALRQQHPELVVVDVRLEEDYWLAHPAGALSNCVFEVAFYDRIQTQVPDHSAPIVVYGAGPDSHESRVAAEKLEQLGYTAVHDLRDVPTAIEANGAELIKQSPSTPTLALPGGTVPVDLEQSRVTWVGRNLLNRHWGHVPLSDAALLFQRGELSGGHFTLDLRSIVCADLEGSDLHAVLIAHLQNDDFFAVDDHPTARVDLLSSSPIEGSAPGSPNLRIQAQLTLRGQTHPITFDATTGYTADGKPAAQATLAFDRTLWGSIYGSGKFFRRLAGHLVNDLVEIQVKVVAG